MQKLYQHPTPDFGDQIWGQLTFVHVTFEASVIFKWERDSELCRARNSDWSNFEIVLELDFGVS